jgi:hypothetical protein
LVSLRAELRIYWGITAFAVRAKDFAQQIAGENLDGKKSALPEIDRALKGGRP